MHYLVYHLLTYHTDGAVEWMIVSLGLLLAATVAQYSIRRQAPRVLVVRRVLRTAAGAFIVFCIYSGYIVQRQAIEEAELVTCQHNLLILGAATTEYVDTTGHYPPVGAWDAAILKYIPADAAKRVFHCPASDSMYGYSYNAALSNISAKAVKDPGSTVMIFDSDGTSRNAAGSAAEFRARHVGSGNFVYADGKPGKARSATANLVWSP